MKRIKNRDAYQRHQRRRTRAVFATRARSATKRARSLPRQRKERLAYGTRPTFGFYAVVASEKLSIIQEPEGTITFFNELMHNLQKRRNTFVQLLDVEEIDYDAIVVLLSIMYRFKNERIPFEGNFPRNGSTAAKLRRSGFFEVLLGREYVPDQDAYSVPSTHSIVTHASRQVDPALGAQIVAGAAKRIWGAPYRLQGIQRVLLELMHNTHNHAAPAKLGHKHWWLSLHFDRRSHQVSFVFVDLGVGVLRSLKSERKGSKWFEWEKRFSTKPSDLANVELLRQIITGKMHFTVTGQPFRGKGLPELRAVGERGWLSGLTIVTNDVFADVEKGRYTTLSNEFEGTLVSWKVDANNRFTA